jgi:hypothetical protein
MGEVIEALKTGVKIAWESEKRTFRFKTGIIIGFILGWIVAIMLIGIALGTRHIC